MFQINTATRVRSVQTLVLFSACWLALSLLFSSTGYAQTLDSEEQAFLTLINNYRQASGLQPLQVSVTLTNASKWMSNDMATKNYFSHTDSLGRDPYQRLIDFGYTCNTW
jgi:uncharacterized protein YkwD